MRLKHISLMAFWAVLITFLVRGILTFAPQLSNAQVLAQLVQVIFTISSFILLLFLIYFKSDFLNPSVSVLKWPAIAAVTGGAVIFLLQLLHIFTMINGIMLHIYNYSPEAINYLTHGFKIQIAPVLSFLASGLVFWFFLELYHDQKTDERLQPVFLLALLSGIPSLLMRLLTLIYTWTGTGAGPGLAMQLFEAMLIIFGNVCAMLFFRKFSEALKFTK